MSERMPVRPDDFEVAQRLAEHRWPDGFVCAHCGCRKAYHLKVRPRVYQCAKCRRQTSVTAEGQLRSTKVRLWVWEDVAACLERPGGESAAAVTREFDQRYETVWRMMQRLRRSLPPACLDSAKVKSEPDRFVGMAWLPLTGLPFQCPRMPSLNRVGVLAAVPKSVVDASGCEPGGSWQAALEFALPVTEELWDAALRSRGPGLVVPRGPARLPELALAPREVRDRLRGAVLSLGSWVGRVHQQISARWFDGYVRFYRASRFTAPGAVSAVKQAIRTDPVPWRAYPPPVPAVITRASHARMTVPFSPRARRVSPRR